MRKITVSKTEVIKKLEANYNTGSNLKVSELSLDPKNFFSEDVSFSDMFGGYEDWLKMCNYEDTDEHYSEHVEFIRSYYKSELLDEIIINRPTGLYGNGHMETIKVIYID